MAGYKKNKKKCNPPLPIRIGLRNRNGDKTDRVLYTYRKYQCKINCLYDISLQYLNPYDIEFGLFDRGSLCLVQYIWIVHGSTTWINRTEKQLAAPYCCSVIICWLSFSSVWCTVLNVSMKKWKCQITHKWEVLLTWEKFDSYTQLEQLQCRYHMSYIIYSWSIDEWMNEWMNE